MKTLAGDHTRPTADRVKEAMFSALMPHIPGSRVLDAFAGSAALGLEALSRGAEAVWFCEQDRGAQRICESNIRDCGLPGARLLKGDVLSILPRLRQEMPELRFELVFLDPPYKSDLLRLTMKRLADDHWLTEDSIVVAESAAKADPVKDSRYEIVREKKYGDTAVRFYRLINNNARTEEEEE